MEDTNYKNSIGYPMAGEVEREKLITREVQRGMEAAREVQKLSEELEMRLQAILQSQPKSVQGGNVPSESMPPLAEQMKNNRKITESAGYNLRSILSRLEL